MRRRPLLPPSTPAALPHGLSRGGIFDAGYVPPTYIDAARATVPTDSPATHDVSEDVFRAPIGFTRSESVRQITGPIARPGMAGFGRAPNWVQGMGMQRGGIVESADQSPLPIHMGYPVPVPHGNIEGGIFGGHRRVIGGMATGARVPKARTSSMVYDPRMPGLNGYGAGPDGLGGFGC